MSGKEQQYIQEAFASNWVAPLGPNVDQFENEVARFTGVKGAVAVCSGTAAIHLALLLLGIEKGDRVFCSSFTFVASANPILYQGAEPVFIDSEPETWNMSPIALRCALQQAAEKGKLPKAVIIVHLYGQSAKMTELLALCREFEVPIIEDAAESLGTTYHGKASGTFGKFGIYSFNGNKIITTSGGGMIVSDNLELLEKARKLATQAREPLPYYQHQMQGYNYRMSNILAGIGRAQIEVLEERIAARRRIFATYRKELAGIPGISFLPEPENTRCNRWLTTITIDKKTTGVSIAILLQALNEDNIEARHVWKPLHLQPLFHDAAYYPHESGSDISAQLFQTGLCLPSGSNLRENEQFHVIECLRQALLQHA
ncbi:aminotransferase class I/II-fold pyridoxal phosphate-dependent enzyme [Bacillaceae bacterium Marseille-Q3522]|nr:aminotransferase class I/II-fold pyridoxal phosphate-dependent enzyme [Bacillaceae bacterium Marseille-Q3522]